MPSLKSFALLSTAMLVAGTSMRARQSQVPVVDVSVPSLNDSGSSEIRGFGLIKFNGVLTDQRRRPLSGVVGITVAIYRDREGGAPLWQESQNVLADSQGNYTVLLGATTGEGIPPETFSSNEPRWLSVTPNVPDSGEQPRVLFVSVAHALKAADADTLGGKPVTEFVLRDSSGDNANGSASLDHAKTSKDRTSGSNTAALTQTGTVGQFAKYVNSSDLGGSFMVETSGGDVGTGAGRTSPPDAALDILGPPGSGWRMVAGNGTIKGGIFTGTTAGSVPLVAIGAFSNHPLAFLTNGGTFSTIIDASGRIGVGTPNPQEKLDVLGNVRTVGSLISTVGTGTPPLVVNSTTQVANLNASFLGGMSATAARTRGIVYLAGCDTCSPLTNDDNQKAIYVNVIGPMTIQQVQCSADAGSPSINLRREGSLTNVLSSDLTCTGQPTSSFSPGEGTLNLNDTLDFKMVSPSGAKRITVVIQALVN